jgi:peptide/nickel transport system permease protein
VTVHHVLPNIVGILVVQGTIQFAIAILVEAGLSFLGLGVQPPAASWGRMLTESQTYAQVQVLQGVAPTIAIFPGLAIFLSVLGLNLLGDGLRDVLDPRLRIARAGLPAETAAAEQADETPAE